MTELPDVGRLRELGLREARIQGVAPLFAGMYAEGWAAAMARADRSVAEMEREMSKVAWDADFNAGLVYKGQIAELERQRQAVLDYLAQLECTNCEHVHDEGDCGAAIPDGRACRCTWGPPQVAVDIRDLLKEQQ